MRKFSEMSQHEIELMSDEDFKSISPFEKRSCHDCGYLKSALSLWCGNKEAIRDRGTSIPGCIKCPYWKPNFKRIKNKISNLSLWNYVYDEAKKLSNA